MNAKTRFSRASALVGSAVRAVGLGVAALRRDPSTPEPTLTW